MSYGYKELTNLLAKTDGLKCAYLNISGLFNKQGIRHLLNETKIDIVTISETHLHSNVKDFELNTPNYPFVRKDRMGKGNNWGGVFLYHHTSIDMYEDEVNTND